MTGGIQCLFFYDDSDESTRCTHRFRHEGKHQSVVHGQVIDWSAEDRDDDDHLFVALIVDGKRSAFQPLRPGQDMEWTGIQGRVTKALVYDRPGGQLLSEASFTSPRDVERSDVLNVSLDLSFAP